MGELSEEESKGRYCRFEWTEDGNAVLKPVKVPEHVKRERKSRIRRREIQRRVMHNRARAQELDLRFVLFLTVAMMSCCFVCCAYLFLRTNTALQLKEIAQLQTQLEDTATQNALAEKRLLKGMDLNEVEKAAKQQLGMRTAVRSQIIYYSIPAEDYMLQLQDVP